MIKPTIGRVVLVTRPDSGSDQPEPALVTYVWNNRLINVGGFDRAGKPFAVASLPLLQDDDVPESSHYAEWMPYQKDQAKTHETSESTTKTEAVA